MMESLFPEKYKKKVNPQDKYKNMAKMLLNNDEHSISKLDLDGDEDLLLSAFNKADMRDDPIFEFDKVIEGEEVELAEIDLKDIQKEEANDNIRLKNQRITSRKLFRAKAKQVEEVRKLTYKELSKNEKKILKKVEYKEEKSLKEFDHKMGVLKESFNDNIARLLKNIGVQRDTIAQSYGPLTLDDKRNEKPIFEISKEVDPEGHKMQEFLFQKQNNIASILSVNVHQARCLKDKISPGYFILRVTCLSRIGGQKVNYNVEEIHEDYKELSKNLRYFNKQKRAFLEKEHREMEVQ